MGRPPVPTFSDRESPFPTPGFLRTIAWILHILSKLAVSAA